MHPPSRAGRIRTVVLWRHRETWLFDSPIVKIGLLEVPPASDAWRVDCVTPERPQIAFPTRSIRTSLIGVPARRADRVITPMHAMLSSRGWHYRRTLIDDRGERSGVFQFSDETLAEAYGGLTRRFEAGVATIEPRLFALQQRLVRTLLAEPRREPLWVEEHAVSVLRACARSDGSDGSVRSMDRRRATTLDAHAEAVREAWRFMHEHLSTPISLADVGRAVHQSPAHFARVFRSMTGETIARSFLQLRLRRALIDVLDTRDELWSIARRWGFADLAQFSKAFRAAFGEPPSAVRRGLRARAGQVRTI
ncbi:MAG: AraC family transcriptional regulator [Planctomycetota bacterium]